MSSTTPLPPYFRINPDQALSDLDAPVTTAGFAAIASAARDGRDDLAGRGLAEDGKRHLRLFSTWEITRYLIPVAQAHFRRVLKQHPDWPQGRSETEGGAKWFTLDEVLTLRAHFGKDGFIDKGCGVGNAPISLPKDPGPRNTSPTARRACPRKWSPSRTSRAGLARHRPPHTLRCRRRSTATGCW